MANYIFSIKSVKYGTPTGSNTMPATGAMTLLPDTVKGSVTIDEGEGTTTKFWVDQKASPVKSVKTEEGEVMATMSFYDIDYTALAALKGGTGNASGWVPATGYSQIEKAIAIETDSGHIFDFYNAHIEARITGGLGRDNLFTMELKATPLMSLDLAGSYKIRPV